MEYTKEVQELIDDPFAGRTPDELRQACASDLAVRALAHEPQEFMIEKFCQEFGYSAADARELFEETKRFLLVGRLVGRSLAPSLPVDRMWHSWILFTKDYHEFGDLLGGYVHHKPIPKGDAAQPPLEPTVQLLEAAFGPCGTLAWPVELGSYGVMDCKAGV